LKKDNVLHEKIIDLSKDGDTLANDITDSALDAVSLIGDARDLEFYVIGNAEDFDEFAVPVFERLKTCGTACLWPKARRSRIFDGADVHILGNYTQPVPKTNKLNILLVQSVVAVPEVLHAMLTHVVSSKRIPSRVDVIACAMSDGIEERLRKSIADHSPKWRNVPIHLHRLETLPVEGDEGIDFEIEFFDHIDNRTDKDFAVMPRWVHAQIRADQNRKD
jgi:hypothetical protein